MSIIVLIGKANVGKSALFNKLTKTENSIVSNIPGTTTDEQYGIISLYPNEHICIDTCNISFRKNVIQSDLLHKYHIYTTIEKSNMILFVVDGEAGLTYEDIIIANFLRKYNQYKIVVINKLDKIKNKTSIYEFYKLGVNNIVITSALNGYGIKELRKTIAEFFKKKHIIIEKTKSNLDNLNISECIKVSLIGKQNVGKSTLINCILKKNKAIVDSIPGTTTNSTKNHIKYKHDNYYLIDTAGIKCKKPTDNLDIECKRKTLDIIKNSDVLVFIIDLQAGVSKIDRYIIKLIKNVGRAFIIVFNKFDLIRVKKKLSYKEYIVNKLFLLKFAKVHFVSALHRIGTNKLLSSVKNVFINSRRKISASLVSKIMFLATNKYHPISKKHNRTKIKLKYAHVGGYNPIIIVIHGKNLNKIKNSYKNYLINFFHKKLHITGAFIKVKFKNK